MKSLPYGVLGELSPAEIHNRMIRMVDSASMKFDELVESGALFENKDLSGKKRDMVSNIDRDLQALCLERLVHDLSGWGRRAEEDNVQILATLMTPWGLAEVTIDPVDGTNLFQDLIDNPQLERGGVSLMISLKLGSHVIAAYVFDLFTKELFFVSPAEQGVLMRRVGTVTERVTIPHPAANTLLLLKPAIEHPELAAWVNSGRSPFTGYEELKSGVGMAFVEFLRGKGVAFARRPGGSFSPWDDSPLICFGNAANIRTFLIKPNMVFEEFVLQPPDRKVQRQFGMLSVPDWFVPQLYRVADVRTL